MNTTTIAVPSWLAFRLAEIEAAAGITPAQFLDSWLGCEFEMYAEGCEDLAEKVSDSFTIGDDLQVELRLVQAAWMATHSARQDV